MMPIQPDSEYQAHLAAGRFMLPAGAGGVPFYPPRLVAPGVGGTDLRWIAMSGRGTVYSSTTIYKRPPEPSYNVALIDLAEGPRMMSRVEGIDPSAVAIGMPVKARIVAAEDGSCVVVFEPEDAA
jgi:uncharacterized protein